MSPILKDMFGLGKWISSAVATVLVATMLTSCAPEQKLGSLQHIDGGIQVAVPALWADPTTGASGIEPATVWVDSTRSDSASAYEINLNDVVAKGGGKQWQAATSSAAAVGTMFSGLDPDDVACRFDITGPIDGPSAGAILTVAVLAALKKHDLNPHITMTGTISPDGSIGPVGLIGHKLQAAAHSGFTTVLLPSQVKSIQDPETGKPVQATDFAHTLGLKIHFVDSVIDAYSYFTGDKLIPLDSSTTFSFSDFTALNTARFDSTEALQNNIEIRLTQEPAAPAGLWEQLELSRAALRSSDVSAANGLAVDVLQSFERWRGTSAFDQLVAEQGIAQARNEFLLSAQQERMKIEAQIDEAVAQAEGFNTAQLLSLPNSLGWLTYGRAILLSCEEVLGSKTVSNDSASLRSYAGLAYEVSAEAELIYPQTMTVLAAVPASGNTKPSQDLNKVSDFTSGYTQFLITAGNAHLDYLHDVLGVDSHNSTLRVTDLVPVAVLLGEEANAISSRPKPLSAELKDSSTALTFYITTTTLVASLQIGDNPEMWLYPENNSGQSADILESSISVGNDLTKDLTNDLLGDGLNAGAILWSADWATAGYRQLSALGRSVSGASIALNELWFDAVTVLSMRGYVNSAKGISTG